jgi:hypothetical protein
MYVLRKKRKITSGCNAGYVDDFLRLT